MGLFLNMGRTVSQWGLGENTLSPQPSSKRHFWFTGNLKMFSSNKEWFQTRSNFKKLNKIQAHEVLQDTEMWTQVLKLLACEKKTLLLKCPVEIPIHVVDSGLKQQDIPLLFFLSVVLLGFYSGSSNPEVSVWTLHSTHFQSSFHQGKAEMASGFQHTEHTYGWTV